MRTIMTAALVALTTLPAIADEVWYSPTGDQLVYQAEQDGFAIFSAPWNGEDVYLYFPELAGNYYERSMHDGFWIGGPTSTGCGAALSGPDGRASYSWGRVELVFDRAEYPTGWTALMGNCMADPDGILRASLAAG
ncbi:hypothetical protein [Pelagovum pacificum]|uniref:Uncharacterized protein n=1 Tax=Pelagovum pacificum TaxID=2588711 RepID=A0A5C5G9Z7_9RHOB|nr:hypothetical protein [Pelagovum pacificum]QQA42521.1 hypothetical protein I8N54_17310 [Pelagovum pacificum]TNY31605.1 hypothetical protein FHY64_16505 [Pelagovum pacificum]